MANLYPIESKRVRENGQSSPKAKSSKELGNLNPSLSPKSKRESADDSSTKPSFKGFGAKDWIEYLMSEYRLSLRTLSHYGGYDGDMGFKTFIDIISVCDYESVMFRIPKRRIQLRINVINHLARFALPSNKDG